MLQLDKVREGNPMIIFGNVFTKLMYSERLLYYILSHTYSTSNTPGMPHWFNNNR
jgi:hypothetical protein